MYHIISYVAVFCWKVKISHVLVTYLVLWNDLLTIRTTTRYVRQQLTTLPYIGRLKFEATTHKTGATVYLFRFFTYDRILSNIIGIGSL